jgi:hypothetical protein
MSSTITPRYGHDPRSAFAATRAFAGRTDRLTPTAPTVTPSRTRRLLRRITGR